MDFVLRIDESMYMPHDPDCEVPVVEDLRSKDLPWLVTLGHAISSDDKACRDNALLLFAAAMDEDIVYCDNEIVQYKGKELVQEQLKERIAELRQVLAGSALELSYGWSWRLFCGDYNRQGRCSCSLQIDNDKITKISLDRTFSPKVKETPDTELLEKIVGNDYGLTILLKRPKKSADAEFLHRMNHWLQSQGQSSTLVECGGRSIEDILAGISDETGYIWLNGLDLVMDYADSLAIIDQYAKRHKISIVGLIDGYKDEYYPEWSRLMDQRTGTIGRYVTASITCPRDYRLYENEMGHDISETMFIKCLCGAQIYLADAQ